MKKEANELFELAGIINNALIDTNYEYPDVKALETADEIMSIGYQKLIWHKVSNNDLPEQCKRVLVAINKQNADFIITVGSYHDFDGSAGWMIDAGGNGPVTAWADLPTYRGE